MTISESALALRKLALRKSVRYLGMGVEADPRRMEPWDKEGFVTWLADLP
jgi:hypothetical protein